MLNQASYRNKLYFGNSIQPQYFQATAPQNGPVNGPAMQGIDAESLKQTAQQATQDNYISNKAEQFSEIDPLKLYAVGLPAWFVTAQAMDVYAKKSRGAYNQTVQYKIGNFGDKVSNFLTNNKIVKSAPVQKISNWISSAAKWGVDKAFDNSAVLRAMKTPSLPELDMVRGQANGMRGQLLYDYPQLADKFLENNFKSVKDLDSLGADKAFIKAKEALIKGGADFKEVMNRAQFELLLPGKDPKIIDNLMKLPPEAREKALQNFKARALGYNGLKHFNAVKGDIQNRWKEVHEACTKANPKMYSKMWTSDKNLWSKVKGFLFGRKVYMSEFANKISSAVGHMSDGTLTHSTKLGRSLPKFVNYYLEGFTNRVAGGKMVALMNATMLAEVLIRTAQAEKSDKFKTFMERTSEMVGFFIFSPIALRLLHMFGGAQYAGITDKTVTNLLTKLDAKKAKISVEEYNAAKEVLLKAKNAMARGKNPTEAYREALNFFNGNANAAKYSSRKAHKAAYNALTGIRKGDVKWWNLPTKLVKKFARILTVGLEQPAAYRKTALNLEKEFGFKQVGQILKDTFKHPKYWLKQGLGYPVRLIAVMFVLMPFLNKLGVKLTHSIFGKPSKSILDENNMESPQVTQTNSTMQNPQIQPNSSVSKPDLSRPTNLLNMAANGQKYENKLNPKYQKPLDNNSFNQSSTNYTLQGNNSDLNGKQLEPVRTYIPSSEGVKIVDNTEDLSTIDAALKRSEDVEKQVMETLAMKW